MATTQQGTGVAATTVTTRLVLTLVGAAGLIVGAFLDWTRKTQGTKLGFHALWTTRFHPTGSIAGTVGLVVIVLGAAALLGLALPSIARLAGALGVVVFVLFAIELYRAPGAMTLDAVGVGAWISLAGAVVAVIAGSV